MQIPIRILMARYQNHLYRIAFSICQNREDAEVDLNPASIRRSRTTRVVRRMCYTAACLVMLFAASNGICYAATGSSLVHTIIVMANGANVEISEDGISVSFTIESTGDLSYTTAENGRLYLNLNDEKTDITDQCSATDYFRKDYTDSEGNTHVIIAGGTVDSYGWAEYIFNAEGKYIFNTMNIPTDDANPDYVPAWFTKAEKDLGLDADALLEQDGSYKMDENSVEQTETVTESAQ